MLLSTENKGLRYRVGERRAIEILAQVGFDAIDYTFTPHMEIGDMPWTGANYREYAKEVKQIADDNGVFFNQAHGPFIFDFNYLPDLDKQIIPMQALCMECCAMLEIKRMVVHPLHDSLYRGENRKRLWDLNVEYYRRLQPYAKEYGVVVSLENLFDVDKRRGCYVETMFSDANELARFYDDLGDTDHFDVLVDTGHSSIVGGDAAEDIRRLGHRVKGLHVHDNNYRGDDHLIPYEGTMDWDSIMKALADIGYEGDLTFEALHPFAHIDERLLISKARYLHDVGRCLIEKFDEYRREGESS